MICTSGFLLLAHSMEDSSSTPLVVRNQLRDMQSYYWCCAACKTQVFARHPT